MFIYLLDLCGSAVDKNPPDDAGDTGLIPGLGRPPTLQGSWARPLQPLEAARAA